MPVTYKLYDAHFYKCYIYRKGLVLIIFLDFDFGDFLNTSTQNPITANVANPAKIVKIISIYFASVLSQSVDVDVAVESDSTNIKISLNIQREIKYIHTKYV